MNALQKSGPILVGLAIGVLLALFIARQTRWIERYQIGSAIPFHLPYWGVGSRGEPASKVLYGPIARTHPGDYQIQLAYTLMSVAPLNAMDYSQVGDPRVSALRGLEARFGDTPSLYANILRYASIGEIGIGEQPADWALGGLAPPSQPQVHETPSSPAVLAAYDRDAAMGERLDPNNAYFPFMRAYGLYAANKNDQAVAELLRAGKDTKFDDYSPDEVEGDWKLSQDLIGGQDALVRLAFEAALLFPHYAKMREVARVAAYQAMLEEQSGNSDQGLAIRNALMHIGSLMRAQSNSFIGTLVGIAITGIAMARPGGAPAIQHQPNETRAEIESQRDDRFCAYLTQIGHSYEIPWVRAETAAGDQARADFQRGEARDPIANDPVRMIQWWAIDFLLLAAVIWLLVAGGVASLAARAAPIRSGEPLPAPARWGFAAGAIFLISAIVLGLVNAGIGWYSGLALLAAAPIWLACTVRGFQLSAARGTLVLLSIPCGLLIVWLSYGLLPGWWPGIASTATVAVPILIAWLVAPGGKEWLSGLFRWKPRAGEEDSSRSAIKAFAGILVVFGVAFGLAFWQMRQFAQFIAAVGMLTGAGYNNGNPNSVSPEAAAMLVSVAIVFFVVALPGGVMAIAALVRKMPVSVALANGYRAWAVPLACLLVIAYGPLILVTAGEERALNTMSDKRLHCEGQWFAQMAGMPWPGPVPETDPALADPGSEQTPDGNR